MELYSGGSYTTGDLDFAGHVPKEVGRKLADAGFRRQGRHWIHENGIFIEFPSSSLDFEEEAVTLTIEGARVVIVSPEDLLVDRLAHWQFWGSTVDAINATRIFCLWRDRLDLQRLANGARRQEVGRAYEALLELAGDERTDLPTDEELERWIASDPLKAD